MSLILAELEARYKLETFDQEAEADRHAALVRTARVRVARRERVNRMPGWFRMVRRGSAV
jgi:hypothetical protein